MQTTRDRVQSTLSDSQCDQTSVTTLQGKFSAMGGVKGAISSQCVWSILESDVTVVFGC